MYGLAFHGLGQAEPECRAIRRRRHHYLAGLGGQLRSGVLHAIWAGLRVGRIHSNAAIARRSFFSHGPRAQQHCVYRLKN